MTWLCSVPFPVTCHTGRVVIEVESAPGATTIVVRGELDLVTRPFLAQQLKLVSRDKPGRLVFDLAGTGFMDCHLEELQIRHQEGPCIAAFEDKELVRAEDLSQEERWPSLSQHAVARGVRAVLASPIPYNQDAGEQDDRAFG